MRCFQSQVADEETFLGIEICFATKPRKSSAFAHLRPVTELFQRKSHRQDSHVGVDKLHCLAAVRQYCYWFCYFGIVSKILLSIIATVFLDTITASFSVNKSQARSFQTTDTVLHLSDTLAYLFIHWPIPRAKYWWSRQNENKPTNQNPNKLTLQLLWSSYSVPWRKSPVFIFNMLWKKMLSRCLEVTTWIKPLTLFDHPAWLKY